MKHAPRTQEPEAGYLDDEFAKFRAERLARRQAEEAAATTPAAATPQEAPVEARVEARVEVPPTAAPAPAPAGAAPEEGYLDDDFARFRAQRLRTGRTPRAMARPDAEASEPSPSATSPGAAPPADEAFFGTTSSDRRRIKDQVEVAREDTSDLPPPPATAPDPAGEQRQAG